MKRVAIVAGETSGDLLAARLIKALQTQRPDWVFEGIAGAEMQAVGCQSLFPMETLSVMGLVEVLKDLPALLKIRQQLMKRWRNDPPDLFIGVDAPDFNLKLAAKLHAAGIPTVHYVSPSVWAWRESRVKKMQGHIDLMLTLFPFEVDFYKRHGIEARFVGHPLADEIIFDAPKEPARQALDLAPEQPVLALLPGSRRAEVKSLGAEFLQTAWRLQQQQPDLQVVVPIAKPNLRDLLTKIQSQQVPELKVTYLEGQSRLLMQGTDYMLLASGTAVLEGMLVGRPMVAAYQLSSLTWFLLRSLRLVRVRYVTLPNHMANEELVPELLQQRAKAEYLIPAMQQLLQAPEERHRYLMQRFAAMHQQLRCDASTTAARAILEQFDYA